MNEQNPSGGAVASSAVPVYYDRSTGLMVFGILTIILGCLCGLMVLFSAASQVFLASLPPSPQRPPPPPLVTLLIGMFMYVGMAVALVWLGIGSIKARRWARALLVIFSWSWLVCGTLGIVSAALILPKVMANLPVHQSPGLPPPPGMMTVIMVVALLVDSFIFIVIPGVWAFFYSSRHVKLTCEWRDPTPRWTDACPLPVLALCCWVAIGSPLMVLMALMGMGVAPFFGMFLAGIPGALFLILLAAVWGYAGWLLYQLDVRGWWLIVIAMAIFLVSSLITYSRHSLLEVYQLIGYPEEQIEIIRKTGLLEGNGIIWATALGALPFLGYLIFIKRYMRAT